MSFYVQVPVYLIPGLVLFFSSSLRADEFPAAIFANQATSTTEQNDPQTIDTEQITSSWLPSTPKHQYSSEARKVPQDPWDNPCSHRLQDLTFFLGIDGSKQPQDYGVNANLGLQANINAGVVLDDSSGLGLQLGTGIVASQNAVRVYELLGEATSRTQNYTTIGLFQKTDSVFVWALAHDFLIESSYDTFLLSQWRSRIGYQADDSNQFGFTGQLRGLHDSGRFNSSTVSLRTINQGSLYWQHVWETSAQTTFWLGLADGHGENNAVTGPAPAQSTVPLLGADFLAPLNDHFALYGETNLMMPADTGTVDAFLGIQWFPGGRAKQARRTPFAPVLSVAAPTTMSVDLR